MNSMDHKLVLPFAQTIKKRNEFFDRFFYDVQALTEAEKNRLSPLTDKEGSILVVHPRKTQSGIAHHETVHDFLGSDDVKNVQAVVVAGVGSSALGTAALARNVANAYGFPVAGVVSGYGASDLIAEAMGGWFFYGATDAVRHGIREAVNGWGKMFGRDTDVEKEASVFKEKTLGRTEDISALEAILSAQPPTLRLLVGHSKGSLMLDYALEQFAKKHETGHDYFKNMAIVTFSALADIPPQFEHVYQFIGEYDGFGMINSRRHVTGTRIPFAGHHLNRAFNLHLDIEDVLKKHVIIP